MWLVFFLEGRRVFSVRFGLWNFLFWFLVFLWWFLFWLIWCGWSYFLEVFFMKGYSLVNFLLLVNVFWVNGEEESKRLLYIFWKVRNVLWGLKYCVLNFLFLKKCSFFLLVVVVWICRNCGSLGFFLFFLLFLWCFGLGGEWFWSVLLLIKVLFCLLVRRFFSWVIFIFNWWILLRFWLFLWK